LSARTARVRRLFRRFRFGPYPRLPTGHVSQSLPTIPDGRISRVRFWPRLPRYCQDEPSPATRNCGAGAPFAPPSWSLHHPFATTLTPQNPAQSLVACPSSWPPSAQSPFAPHGRYPRRDGLASRLEGRYPLVVARTGSCARPSPSQRLRFTLGRRVFAGCRQSLLRDGPSRHYLCDPCAGARTPTPPRSAVAHVRFFTEDAGLTPE
jgi:hypothetical protein